MALQASTVEFNNDQDHGCCAIFKSIFKKQKTAAQTTGTPATPLALPKTSATNEDKQVEPEENQGPITQPEELQASIIPNDSPTLSKDEEFSQMSQEAKAKFRNAKDQLEKAISKTNSKSPIEVSWLDSNDIGNLPQMAQDIDLAISEFRKERESQKGKGTANKWVHKVSFAGQRILGTAENIASEFFPSTACSLVSCTVGYLLRIADDASGRTEGINITLDTMAKAARSIKAIDIVPTNLAVEQLHEMHNAALDLCTAILSYLTIVIKDINMGMLQNTFTTLVQGEKPFNDGSNAIMEAIKRYRDCRDDLTLPILVNIHQAPRRKEFYEWLSPTGAYTRHKIIGDELELCDRSTVPVFLLSDQFQQWSQGSTTLFYGYGNPGAGKSFMTFLAIQYLEGSLRLTHPPRITSFYFDYSVKKSAVDVLASLLKQLASPLENIPSCLKSLYGNFKPEEPRPDKAKLLNLFVQCAETYQEVFVFLDAFDECDPSLRGDIVSIIKHLHERKMKVWVTTQPRQLDELITEGLDDAIKAQVKAKETDVTRYLSGRLTNVKADNELKALIIRTISSGVDGIFLLAKVQLDMVLHAEYPPAMRAQLGDLPKTPSDSYMKSLERIKLAAEHPKLAAIHALGWIYHAKRKLEMEELIDAVGWTTKINYKFTPNELTDMCRGLVLYDKSSGIVEFIHSTVESFLSDFSLKATTGIIDDLRPYFLSDVDVATTCVTYLSLTVFDNPCLNDESLEERLRQYKFSGYAACYWADHVREIAKADPNVQEAIFEAFKFDGRRKSMEQLKNGKERSLNLSATTSKSLLHVLVEHRLASICMYPLPEDTLNTIKTTFFPNLFELKESRAELVQGTILNAKDSEGDSVLHYAVRTSQWEVVRWLIEKKADVNASDWYGRTVLYIAAQANQWEVVKWLIGKGADVNARDLFGKAVLHCAAEAKELEVVKLLIEKKADVNASDRYGRTVLYIAAKAKQWEVVKWLIENGAEVNAIDCYSHTVLHIAAMAEQWEVVKWLIENGADVKAINCYGCTVLHIAAAADAGLEVFEWLVAEASEIISVENRAGETALDISKRAQHDEVVKFLSNCIK